MTRPESDAPPSHNTSAPAPATQAVWMRAGAIVLLGVLGAAFPMLSIFCMTGGFVLSLTSGKLIPAHKRAWWALSALGAVLVVVGLVRFMRGEAMPGITEAGLRATTKSATYRLRELRIAQDIAREQAVYDPDGDGVGSAGFVDELTRARPFRGQGRIEAPLLRPRYATGLYTKDGAQIAPIDGYLFQVCLPKKGGGLTANPADAIDDERAERVWVAYGWPTSGEMRIQETVFIDAWERIYWAGSPKEGAPYLGKDQRPACNAALPALKEGTPVQLPLDKSTYTARDGHTWRPFKGKKTARAALPGAGTAAPGWILASD